MNDTKINREFVSMLSKRATDIKDHIWTLFNLVQQIGAKVVVELGAGQSTYALLAAVKETGGRFWSIDKLTEAHLRGFPEGRGLLEQEPRYNFIHKDDLSVAISWDKKIDFLFIDTSHQREHTKCELIVWTPFVRTGGIVAMHDTFHKLGHAVGCRGALDEFLSKNKGKWKVRHIESCGGLSILTRLK